MNDRDLIAQRILLHLMENPANHYINAADQATALTDAVLAAIGDRMMPDMDGVMKVTAWLGGGVYRVAINEFQATDITPLYGEGATIPAAIRDALENAE
jgi:hypothetical protein